MTINGYTISKRGYVYEIRDGIRLIAVQPTYRAALAYIRELLS